MSNFQSFLEPDLDEAEACLEELAVLVKALDLLSDRLSSCECANPEHDCSRWMVNAIRCDLDAQRDCLGGILKGLRR